MDGQECVRHNNGLLGRAHPTCDDMDRGLPLITPTAAGKPPAKSLSESVKRVQFVQRALWRQEGRDRGAIYPEPGWDIVGKCLDRRPATPRKVIPTKPPRSHNPTARGRHIATWLAANAAAVPDIVSVYDIIGLLPVKLSGDLSKESLLPTVARLIRSALGFVRIGEVSRLPAHGHQGRMLSVWARPSTAAAMEPWNPVQIAEAYSQSPRSECALTRRIRGGQYAKITGGSSVHLSR